MERIGIDPKTALNGKKTFYVKHSQNNGYYPIDKFVWNEEKNAWEQFIEKNSGWHSYGCAYAEPLTIGNKTITNFSWWLYIFEHNGCIISYNEMQDNRNYNED